MVLALRATPQQFMLHVPICFRVLYQGTQPGGQLTTTNDVENFPGYPDGITGPAMMLELQAQAERFGTDVRDGWVTKVDFSGPIHKVWINGTKEIHCETDCHFYRCIRLNI